MPFTDIAPPPAPSPPGTGFSFGVTITKRGVSKARLIIRRDKQDQHWCGSIVGRRFFARAGRGSDEGRLLLVQADDGDLEAKSAFRGSASIVMAAWDLLPKDKRPAGSCRYVSSPSNKEVVLELPSFARPSGVGGRIAAEHAIKRVARRANG